MSVGRTQRVEAGAKGNLKRKEERNLLAWRSVLWGSACSQDGTTAPSLLSFLGIVWNHFL